MDSRTDIWAFGCVLFEMLTGRRPFAGDNVTDVLVAQKALRFALTISEEVYAVQVLAEELETRRAGASVSSSRCEANSGFRRRNWC